MQELPESNKKKDMPQTNQWRALHARPLLMSLDQDRELLFHCEELEGSSGGSVGVDGGLCGKFPSMVGPICQ
jgi:hypothetical protein